MQSLPADPPLQAPRRFQTCSAPATRPMPTSRPPTATLPARSLMHMVAAGWAAARAACRSRVLSWTYKCKVPIRRVRPGPRRRAAAGELRQQASRGGAAGGVGGLAWVCRAVLAQRPAAAGVPGLSILAAAWQSWLPVHCQPATGSQEASCSCGCRRGAAACTRPGGASSCWAASRRCGSGEWTAAGSGEWWAAHQLQPAAFGHPGWGAWNAGGSGGPSRNGAARSRRARAAGPAGRGRAAGSGGAARRRAAGDAAG